MAVIDLHRWQHLSPLLDELLPLDGVQRAERLRRLRSSDDPVACEVQALLAQQDTIERKRFLDGHAVDDISGDAATLAGRTIGAYTLERPLGAGGMGSVWLARRSDGRFEGAVAVKLLSLALLGRGGAERFAREGTLLARLAHPNIARLLDAGVSDGCQPYLVLEHVEGEAIDRWCAARALGIEARVRVMLDVLAAVEHAHSNLVLHRDLKPSNILVTRGGDAKLLDFGIAKLMADTTQPAPATELAQLAGRAFTPDYAAPEQVLGGDVTTATDVYALGVLLYTLLGGVHPTARPTATPVDRLRAVVEAEPQRLSDAVVRHRAALRGDLDNIVAKALKKSLAERYASAAAFAEDLRRYLASEPVGARADTWAYRGGKFVRRHRIGVAAASATLLALVAGVIGTGWQAIEARRERDEAMFQTERALARGNLVNLMLGTLGDADRPLTRRELLERSVHLVDKQFARNPSIAVDLLLPIAGHYSGLGQTDKELAVMQRAGEFAAASGDAQLIAAVACNTVDAEIWRGRVDRARAQLQTGLGALATLARPQRTTIVACLRAEADVARADGDLDLALSRVRKALDLVERAGHANSNQYPMLLSFLRALHEDRGELRTALAVSQRLQRLQQDLGRSDSADHLNERRAEAALLMAMGEYREARPLLDAVVQRALAASTSGALRPRQAYVVGLMSMRLGDLDAAHRHLQGAATRSRAQGFVWLAVQIELALAQVLIEMGQAGDGEQLLAAVEAAQASGRATWQRITPPTVRATLRLAQGEAVDAARLIDAELARLSHPTANASVALAAALRLAVRAHAAAGDTPRTRRLAGDAVSMAERIARDPLRSADVGEALLLLAQAERRLGNAADAAATARRAAQALANGLHEGHPLTREALALAAG